MDTFKVGEVAILQNLERGSVVFNGEECTIIGDLQDRTFIEYGTSNQYKALHYLVSFGDQPQFSVGPMHLRKKKPPQEPLANWEDVPFYKLIKASKHALTNG